MHDVPDAGLLTAVAATAHSGEFGVELYSCEGTPKHPSKAAEPSNLCGGRQV